MTNRGSQFAYRSRFLLFGWTWVVLVAGPASLGIAIFSASAWGDRAGTLYFYGWPLRFMTYRDYYTDPFDQALMAAPIEGGLGGVFPTPTWTEQEDEVLEFSTFALVFDVVLAVAFIVSAPFFVEGSCRRNFLPLRFGLVSFFALFGFVGTWLALSRIMSGAGGDEYWHALLEVVWFVIMITICLAWFGLMRFVTIAVKLVMHPAQARST